MISYKSYNLFFDKKDYELLSIVNDVLNREKGFKYLKKLLYANLHPHGIKELAASKGLRIAYAAINLLKSLEVNQSDVRLSALRSLRDEVMNSANGDFRKNTARVLLQIMKELVRAHGNEIRQLELAHDFRMAAFGKPRHVRKELKRYHLLEMPEEWNQISFDDHVHDANTKGRKSSSHLIMDAWIKGIRKLTVIYYNFIRPNVAQELLEAASLMDIEIRIGVEFSARFYNKYVQFIWIPRGFLDAQDFLSFLSKDEISLFMDESGKVSEYKQAYVLKIFEAFNLTHRPLINEEYDLNVPFLNQKEFLEFVGTGQLSLLHLSAFIYAKLLPLMQKKAKEFRLIYNNIDDKDQKINIKELVGKMNLLDSETILNNYLRPTCNPSIPDINVPNDNPDLPHMLKLSSYELLKRLLKLPTGCRISLTLSGLNVEDTLELLYDCKGMITHIEIFNLKDYFAGKNKEISKINKLQQAINEDNAIKLKRIIIDIIYKTQSNQSLGQFQQQRTEKLKTILHNISCLKDFYKGSPLKTCIGSDSTGRSRYFPGMGLIIKETLPYRARKEIEYLANSKRLTLPIKEHAYLNITYIPKQNTNKIVNIFYKMIKNIPLLNKISEDQKASWIVKSYSACMKEHGNIISLGGIAEEKNNGIYIEEPLSSNNKPTKIPLRYLNSILKNTLKVIIGFIPAYATFALTKDWWFLAYFGAFIWFGITGFRNILQSVLGGGGIRRSPLLRWNDYVSWDRITDSLLYTGFSVPLLDYIVKTVLLDNLFNINTMTNPSALYAFMALANGIYISVHNTFRGLPKGAIFGNFFRSILSIPIAIIFNAIIAGILSASGVVGINSILQKWAAVISKAASDCVAGIIEGTADRHKNIITSTRDYKVKFRQLIDIYATLEMLFPEIEVIEEILKSPKKFMRKFDSKILELETIIIINALDLLYFWMYQPRARNVMHAMMQEMSDEERKIIVNSQFVLTRQRQISQMFLDGFVGKNFAKALAFYLDRFEEYLNDIKKMI